MSAWVSQGGQLINTIVKRFPGAGNGEAGLEGKRKYIERQRRQRMTQFAILGVIIVTVIILFIS